MVTGKPLELGGSAGRREATGRGVSIVAREAARHAGFALKGARVAVQGFGNVGSVSARLLAAHGRADRRGHRLEGRRLRRAGPRRGRADRATRARTRRSTASRPGAPLTNEELFTLDVDILVPAALENQITAKNAADVRARVIVEGANGPTTPEAHRVLHERGVFIVPDILANAGGVTASYFEWVQNRHGYFWSEEDVNERLEAKMMAAFETVLKTARRYRVDLRTAAYVVAIDRVATVTRMRGMYA